MTESWAPTSEETELGGGRSGRFYLGFANSIFLSPKGFRQFIWNAPGNLVFNTNRFTLLGKNGKFRYALGVGFHKIAKFLNGLFGIFEENVYQVSIFSWNRGTA
jgi:hypothetical protein